MDNYILHFNNGKSTVFAKNPTIQILIMSIVMVAKNGFIINAWESVHK